MSESNKPVTHVFDGTLKAIGPGIISYVPTAEVRFANSDRSGSQPAAYFPFPQEKLQQLGALFGEDIEIEVTIRKYQPEPEVEEPTSETH